MVCVLRLGGWLRVALFVALCPCRKCFRGLQSTNRVVKVGVGQLAASRRLDAWQHLLHIKFGRVRFFMLVRSLRSASGRHNRVTRRVGSCQALEKHLDLKLGGVQHAVVVVRIGLGLSQLLLVLLERRE